MPAMSAFADFPTIDHDAALAAAASGAVLVTANKRLARRLHTDYGRLAQAGGREVWERPEILPFEVWLANQVRSFDDPPVLLQPAQAMHLWRRVVDDWAGGQGERGVLLQRAGCARQAAEAWRLMHDFAVPWTALDGAPTFETKTFRDLAAAYRRQLTAHSVFDSAALPGWLVERLQSGAWRPPERLLLAGFLDLTPATEGLCTALAAAGCRVEWIALPAIADRRCRRCRFDDTESEIRAAAGFARACLLADPEARISIVALDLAGLRVALERVFDEVLTPQSLLEPNTDIARPFEITLGTPLAGEPLVYDALLALELAAGPAEFGTVSRLLRSPFIAADSAAPLLEAALRTYNPGRMDASALAAIAERRAPHAGALAGALRRCVATLEAGGRASPPAWSERLSAALAALGWPGGRSLSSREYQALETFDETLETLAALGAVARPWTLGEALAELRLLLGERIFQPASPAAPVLITEPLQALGLSFDHLWWLGLNAGDWPPPPRPNPFLPYAVQQRYTLPRATAAGELERATTLTAALFAAARESIASWPQNAGDEPLQPSPLLAELDEQQPAAPSADYRGTIFESRLLESYVAGPAPPLPSGRRPGGAGLLEDQSACPFKAFAKHRLGATPLPSVSIGLNAMQRGSLAHRCLQAFYQAAGRRLPPAGECTGRIEMAVDAVLAASRREMPALTEPRLAAVERRRLCRLLADWIEIDRARPVPFEVVALEEKRPVTIGPLALNVRIDRIDRLEQIDSSGADRVLIDYKSGEKKPGAWGGERPEEPQLPLYALDEAGALAAVCYANLKPGAMGYQGIARDAELIPGVKPLEKSPLKAQATDFETLLATWRRSLAALANEHAAGDAAVRPRDASVCRYCGLEALCRIDERRGPGGEFGASDGGDENDEDGTP